ncbi:beta-lactamase/transpeptidase-like protein [Aspergillus karnatakaensis]|uniref:serine hydrolase domain-containing protein n=1 Tax=Aspergillus karnatakaensis TaxID=1810916 RepID=UPI003CCDF66D
MRNRIASGLLFTGLAVGQICSLPGSIFPPPQAAGESPILERARRRFNYSLEQLTHPSGNAEQALISRDYTSFAIQIYSASDPKPLLEHYQSAKILKSVRRGVRSVDENTVFRVGSVTKLWTTLLLLIESGFSVIHEPVHKYVPQLQEFIGEVRADGGMEPNPIDVVEWEDVTVGELISHTAGMERAFGVGDIATLAQIPPGLPPLPVSAIPPCGLTSPCTRSQFFSETLARHPIFPTASGPAYSNDAFQLLRYVLESISGKSYKELLKDRLIKPLKLTRTSYDKPEDRVGIIPHWDTGWGISMEDFSPAGALYTSTKDLSTLGRAILNSEILSPALTRRWLKPVAHTSDRTFSVGYPWEIFSFNDSIPTTLYTKAGDFLKYSAMIGLSPTHNIGFTIFAAGDNTTAAVWQIADLVATIILLALDDIANSEAQKRFGGVYATENSTITILTDDRAGLGIAEWHNNGVNMRETIGSLQSGGRPEELDIRLYPTGLEDDNRISFRSIVSKASRMGPESGPLTRACKAWLMVDDKVYGSVGVDEFVFRVGEDGVAVSIEPRALRMTLPREEVDSSGGSTGGSWPDHVYEEFIDTP